LAEWENLAMLGLTARWQIFGCPPAAVVELGLVFG